MTKSEMTISKLKVLGCKIREMYDGLYKYKLDSIHCTNNGTYKFSDGIEINYDLEILGKD